MSANVHQGHDDISKHVRTYLVVFAALAALTIVTVGISYLHLPTKAAIALALAVAITKGGLVAAVFMHLIDEVRAIYQVLLLTLVFFAAVMTLPSSWHNDLVTVKPVWSQGVPKRQAEGHDAHAQHDGAPKGDLAVEGNRDNQH
jgi:cytochrome c oxidase subunit IV